MLNEVVERRERKGREKKILKNLNIVLQSIARSSYSLKQNM